MRNYALLIRKDFIAATSSNRNAVFLLVIYLVMMILAPGTSAMMFSILVFVLVLALFSTEENDLVCNVTGILPIRRNQPVIARYLYAYTVQLGGFALCCLVNLVVGLFASRDGDWFSTLLVAVATSLAMISITMPLIYRFGMVKMQLIVTIIYFIIIGATMALSNELIPALSALDIGFAPLLLLGSFLLSVISMGVSVKLAPHRR